MIDITKLDEVTFSILVLWLNGAFSTGEIAKAIEVTLPKVKATVRAKEVGGHMPAPRADMTQKERQDLLNYLKENRIDDGRLKYDWCFVASKMSRKVSPIRYTPPPVAEKPAAVVERKEPEPDPNTREGRKEIRRRKREESWRAEREKVERERGGGTRGIEASPLEWLYDARLLADPTDVARKSRDKTSSEMRRYEGGSRLRGYLEDAQIGGFKEVSMEVATGGMGIAIQERFVMAQSALRAVQSMANERDYTQLVAVVFHDEFVWKDIPSKIAKDFIYEEIRRGLDIVALYLGMMPADAFQARWGYAPELKRGKSREEVRATIWQARELIKDGVRQS